jgi:hypothetical protein
MENLFHYNPMWLFNISHKLAHNPTTCAISSLVHTIIYTKFPIAFWNKMPTFFPILHHFEDPYPLKICNWS